MQEKDIDDSEDTMRILRKGIPKLNEEGKIVGWLLQPDTVANIFFLKTKGKKRGYVERQEFDFNPSEVINVTVSPSVIGHRKDILEP